MPLAFESLNHGTVAFGYFNIETDLLLLEHLFFFASDFCRVVETLAKDDSVERVSMPGYDLPYRVIGDLHGAIAGSRLSGFIGEVYKMYPFPRVMEAFKQNPEGYQTQQQVEEIIERFGEKADIAIQVFKAEKSVSIGEYLFNYPGFHALLTYVWRGGYPRWKDEVRPDYVREVATAVRESHHPLFEGMAFDP